MQIWDFQQDFFFSYFGHMIKLSANIHDLSANMTKIVCKCRIQLEFYTIAFRSFCKPDLISLYELVRHLVVVFRTSEFRREGAVELPPRLPPTGGLQLPVLPHWRVELQGATLLPAYTLPSAKDTRKWRTADTRSIQV